MNLNILQYINTFNDIYEIIEDYLKKEKGDLFEHLTYYLFKLSPLLNHNLQNIWMYSDIPIKILEELKLPTKDKGIDLLALITLLCHIKILIIILHRKQLNRNIN